MKRTSGRGVTRKHEGRLAWQNVLQGFQHEQNVTSWQSPPAHPHAAGHDGRCTPWPKGDIFQNMCHWARVVLMGMCEKTNGWSCRSDIDTSRAIVSADRSRAATARDSDINIAPTCGDHGPSLMHHCFLYVHKNLPERNDLLEMWMHTVH